MQRAAARRERRGRGASGRGPAGIGGRPGRRRSSRRLRVVLVGAAAGLLAAGSPTAATGAAAQELADFDYENLSFRGVGLWGSAVLPTTVEPTAGFGVRFDLGYLGPGIRIVPSASYWSSELESEEVASLEASLDRLGADVDLGTIDRSALTLGLDAHVVWRLPYGLLTYAGGGAAAHFLNGGGEAVDGTFVEDLLDSVSPGLGVHAGVEYPLLPAVRLFGEMRYEVLDDLRYGDLRVGGQFMFGPAAPGEVAR